MPSPTKKTLDRLQQQGYCAEVVERWVPQANVRRDLFHCIDVIALHRREPGVLAIQATTVGNLSTRLAKAKAQPELALWLRCGNRFQVWGWEHCEGRWTLKMVEVRAEDLATMVVSRPPRRGRQRQRTLFHLIEPVAPTAGD
jgi:hypothetical protein